MSFFSDRRCAFVGVFFAAMVAISVFPMRAWAEEAPSSAKSDGDLPPQIETALGELLEATTHNKDGLVEKALEPVLKYVGTLDARVSLRPASREHGSGAYVRESLNVPLRDFVRYALDPSIPGETLYPTSVRRNRWLPGSDILKNSGKILNAAWPPASPAIVRGLEYEETTPDTSSGCYYEYRLQRLFALTAYDGRTALISVSLMPKESEVGHRGAIVGSDKDWLYVYTPTQGTNLTMMTWAETYLYGSASVTVFIESAPGSGTTDMYVFKWAKAGWSGMNVVKESHITEGLKRFTSGLRQVMTSPKRPSPEDIARRFKKLSSSDDAALRAELRGLATHLEAISDKNKPLQEKDFQNVLQGGNYPDSLDHDELVSELMKWYMRGQIGALPW